MSSLPIRIHSIRIPLEFEDYLGPPLADPAVVCYLHVQSQLAFNDSVAELLLALVDPMEHLIFCQELVFASFISRILYHLPKVYEAPWIHESIISLHMNAQDSVVVFKPMGYYFHLRGPETIILNVYMNQALVVLEAVAPSLSTSVSKLKELLFIRNYLSAIDGIHADVKNL